MARFLLIHGASHGAWCWDKIVPLLQNKGHDVTAIDLPSHGEDPTPPSNVSMESYVQAALRALSPETILVGHSLGGLTITLAADRAPENVKALVYLCALVPKPGLSFADFRKDAISPAVPDAQTVDHDAGVATVIPDKAAAIFYHDCTKEDQDFAIARLSPQPIALMAEKLEFEPPTCPMHYIRCLADRVVYPDYQRAVSAGWDHVHDLDMGHSPFLSDPEALVAILEDIATEHS